MFSPAAGDQNTCTCADHIFIREQPVSREELFSLLAALQDSFDHGQQAGIIVRSEGAVFSTAFIKETIATLLEPKREVRETILGHLQRGGYPTAFDRVLAKRFGAHAFAVLQDVLATRNGSFHIAGVKGKDILVNQYKEQIDGIDNSCPPEFVAELQNCFSLMSQIKGA